MEYVISVIVITIELISELNVGTAFLKIREKTNYRSYLIVGAIYILFTFWFTNFVVFNQTLFKLCITVSTLTAVYYALIEGNIVFMIFLSAFSIGLNYRFEYLTLAFFSVVLHYEYERVIMGFGTGIIFIVFAKTMYFLTTYFIRKIRMGAYSVSNLGMKRRLPAAIFSVSHLITLILVFNIEYYYGANSYISMIIAFLSLGVCVVMFFLLDNFEAERQVRQDNLILQQRIDSEMNSVETFKSMYAEQRKLSHDFKNHLLAIKNLTDRPEELKSYVDRLINDNANRNYTVNTNNLTVDAVLNPKLSAANSEGISVRFELGDLSGIKIENKDIVIMLANALDNAIEACRKVENKFIKIRISDDEDGTLISIINSSPEVKEDKSGGFISHKEDTLLHGYGLKNIESTAKKYGGTVVTDYRDNRFQLTIMIDKK